MKLDITLENYRCFPSPNPARFSVGPGFTSLVGPNNSGKSSILKFFFEFRPFFQETANLNLLTNMLRGQRHRISLHQVPDTDEVFSNTNQEPIHIAIAIHHDFSVGGELPYVDSMTFTVHRDLSVELNLDYQGKIDMPGLDRRAIDTRLVVGDRAVARLESVFEASKALSSTIYVGPFRNLLNVTQSQQYFDISVGTAVVQAWKSLKTGNSSRNRERALDLERSVASIFGFGTLSLDASDDGVSFLATVNGKSFRLQDLGSGISQVILTFISAAASRTSLLLIDEPESNLHPTLQISFLTALAAFFDVGVVLATHSLGLARAISNDIYSFQLERDGVSRVRRFDADTRLPELIGELSFGAYQDLGRKKILLVEGPTEVTAVSQLLRKLNKDHEVVLVPLGGDSLINRGSARQLSEMRRLSSGVGALIDSERNSQDESIAAPRLAFIRNCQRLGITAHILQKRAFENYLPTRAIRAVKRSELYRELEPFESLNNLGALRWSKEENWRICHEMSETEFQATGDLHGFLCEFVQ